MQHTIRKNRKSYSAALITAFAATLAWIFLAVLFRHDADTDPRPVQLSLSGLALWFVACGVWAVWRQPAPDTRLFFYSAMLAGIHWGGPIGIGPESLQTLQLGAFIVVSTVLGEAVTFDLARTAKNPNIARRRWIIYTPFALGVALLLLLIFMPNEKSLLDAFVGLYSVGVAIGFAGAAVWLLRLISRNEPDKKGVLIVFACLILGASPDLLASTGILGSIRLDGLLNLPLAVFPLSLAWFLTKKANVE